MNIIKLMDYLYNRFKNRINKDTILFICPSWYKNDKIMNIITDIRKNIGNCKKFIILTNTLDEIDFYKQYYQHDDNIIIMHCNANVFIDENLFVIKNLNKEYDLVVNSSFYKYKNTQIAKLVENTCHIGYYMKCFADSEIVIPTYGKCVNFYNNKYNSIPIEKVGDYCNKSYVGGIFSPIEGNCRASSEYLLCGLPVVSIESKGGRDFWYNENNSIICENNEESVLKAVLKAKENVINGIFNREKIRQEYIDKMNIYRQKILDCIYEISGIKYNYEDIRKIFLPSLVY